MATPNINLKSLEFEGIKSELVNYIKSKEEFSDYNFDGSALSTIVDLLTYNTFYQILFQNILVNEMFLDSAQKLESIISHAKIQGYVVPGKTSSTATLRVTGTNGSTIPAYTKFRAVSPNSQVRLFYNTDAIIMQSNGTNFEASFDVYEAKRFVVNSPFSINVDTQSVFIPEIDIEFKTLKVEVDENNTGTFEEYEVSTSVEPNISSNSKMCFLERRVNGYDVKFTGIYDNVSGTFNTSSFDSNTKIRITYGIPSGSVANGASAFSFNSAAPSGVTEVVSTSGISSRGTDQPSIDSLKFTIPRVYSAQSRVVTADDVKAFLVEQGFATSFSQIGVTGGEEIGKLGQVFFSVDGLSTENISKATSELQRRSIAGISFEYGSGEDT